MSKLTKEQAIKLYESGFWEPMSHRERAVFQMHTKRLCIPFDVFHEAGESAPPTFEQIIEMIPEEKRQILTIGVEAAP